MGAKRCLVCGSGEISLWLGGSIGALYRCPECQYMGPVVIESEPLEGLNETPRFQVEVEFGLFWDQTERLAEDLQLPT